MGERTYVRHVFAGNLRLASHQVLTGKLGLSSPIIIFDLYQLKFGDINGFVTLLFSNVP